MIDFWAENARAVLTAFAIAGVVAVFLRVIFTGEDVMERAWDMIATGFMASSLPASFFFAWMGLQPELIPKMAGVFEQFFIHLGVYGAVSFCVLCYALWRLWLRPRKN